MKLTFDQLVICQEQSLRLLNLTILEMNEALEFDNDNDILIYYLQSQIDAINEHLDSLGFNAELLTLKYK
jgi:hypothetical protein